VVLEGNPQSHLSRKKEWQLNPEPVAAKKMLLVLLAATLIFSSFNAAESQQGEEDIPQLFYDARFKWDVDAQEELCEKTPFQSTYFSTERVTAAATVRFLPGKNSYNIFA